MSLEEVEVETLLILPENLDDLLLELDVPVSRWMFPVPDLLQKVYCSICDRENELFTTFRRYHLFRIESFCVDFRYVHLFQILNVHNQNVSFPNSSRVQDVTEEYTR